VTMVTMTAPLIIIIRTCVNKKHPFNSLFFKDNLGKPALER